MPSHLVSSIRQAAEDKYASGLLCAESVVSALASAQGISSEFMPMIATGFCSGIARTGGPCGALTGAVMGIGLDSGRNSSGESVQPTCAAKQRLVSQFEEEFGAKDCFELLGCDLSTPEGQTAFKEGNLNKLCAKFVGRATEIAAEIIFTR